MLNLVGKDIRVVVLYLCLIVPTLGLLVVGALFEGKAFLALSCVMAATVVAVALMADWTLGTESFVHSLPVSRTDVVKARYTTSLLLAGGCLILSAGIAVIFASNYAVRVGAWPAWVAVEMALTAVVYVGVYIAVFLGCLFRLGMARGGAVSTMAFIVLAEVGFLYVNPEALAKLMKAVGAATATAGVVLAMALIIWLSMRIAMRSYERREF